MPFVYFIYESGDLLTFKIGKTANHPADRMDQLQTGNPRKLKLYRWIKTDNHSATEEYLHARFHEAHIRGEWFHITTELIDAECAIIAQTADAIVSGAWERYDDNDRLKVKQERKDYRGKISPEEAAARRKQYMQKRTFTGTAYGFDEIEPIQSKSEEP